MLVVLFCIRFLLLLLYQEDACNRGTLQPHLTAVIIENKSSQILQLFGQGNPPLAVHMCVDYWDGRVINALSAEERRLILDTYQQWAYENFEVVAFTYTPVPTVMYTVFDKRKSLGAPPLYLVRERGRGCI